MGEGVRVQVKFPDKLDRREMAILIKEAELVGVRVERLHFQRSFYDGDQTAKYAAWGYGREWRRVKWNSQQR
jgi:hypothetical protein